MFETMTRKSLQNWEGVSLALAIAMLTPIGQLQAEEIKPTSERWESTIRAFEKSDKANPAKAHSALFIGSSSIRMWKSLAADFPNTQTINRGFGGSQIVDSIYFASRIVIPYAPNKIFLYAGDNDIGKGKSAEIVLRDFKLFADIVHHALPKTEIYFIAIKPSLKRWTLAPEMKKANDLVARYARGDERLGFVDVWTPMLDASGKPDPALFIEDGLHMNPTGYRIWTAAVRPFL